MKKPLFFVFTLMVTISACSKKSNAPATPTIVYINGADYSTVVMGSQTWTAENYDGDGGEVFNNGPDTGTNGKLYTIAESEAITLPTGWRIPTRDDFNSLLASLGVSEPPKGSNSGNDASGPPVRELMSTSGWINGSGNDASGFNALPVGFYGAGFNANQSFQWKGTNAVFICSSNYNGTPLCFYIYQYPSANLAGTGSYVVLPTDRASVRFVKDN